MLDNPRHPTELRLTPPIRYFLLFWICPALLQEYRVQPARNGDGRAYRRACYGAGGRKNLPLQTQDRLSAYK